MKKIEPIFIGILLVLIITLNGCDNSFARLFGFRSFTVDTWEEWQVHLSGNIFDETGARVVKYEPDSIRSDFALKFDELFCSQVIYRIFGKYSKTDSVFIELRRLKLIGVWRENKILHISNEIEFDISGEFFKEWTESYQWYLDDTIKKYIDGKISEPEYIIFSTMNSFFTKLIIHGPEDQITEFELPHYFRLNSK